MKKITFNTKFDGLNKTLQLIPESYKVEGKKFVMSDGEQTLKIKWSHGKPTVLETTGTDYNNSDLDQMKHLMEYKSSTTTGNLIGEEKVAVNGVFRKMLKEGFDNERYDELTGLEDDGMGEEMPMDNEMPVGDEIGNADLTDGGGDMSAPEANDSIINNAIQILKDASKTVDNQEAVNNLESALNQFQGDMNGGVGEAGMEVDGFEGPELDGGQPVYSDDEMSVDDYGRGDGEFDVDLEEDISLGDDMEMSPFDLDNEHEISPFEDEDLLDEYSGSYIKDIIRVAKEAYRSNPAMQGEIDAMMKRFRSPGNWDQFENSLSTEGVDDLFEIIKNGYNVHA